jgi:hypothetical protein
MWALLVVDAHGLFDHFGSLFEVGGTLQQEFALENAVDPFGQGILITVVAVGHRAAQAVAPMNVLIVGRAILNPAIGVMDQRLARLARAQCVFQRLTDLFGLQAVVNVMADDSVRERIGDQAQIDKWASSGQVRDIGNPNLFGSARYDLIRSGFQQIRMTPEAMVALSRFVVRPVRHDQQACGAQHIEQPVSSQLDALPGEFGAKQIMQFACPKPRLAKPDVPDKGGDACRLRIATSLRLATLVIRLPANAHIAAGPFDAQLFDPLLRDDLPEGFFTVTP